MLRGKTTPGSSFGSRLSRTNESSERDRTNERRSAPPLNDLSSRLGGSSTSGAFRRKTKREREIMGACTYCGSFDHNVDSCQELMEKETKWHRGHLTFDEFRKLNQAEKVNDDTRNNKRNESSVDDAGEAIAFSKSKGGDLASRIKFGVAAAPQTLPAEPATGNTAHHAASTKQAGKRSSEPKYLLRSSADKQPDKPPGKVIENDDRKLTAKPSVSSKGSDTYDGKKQVQPKSSLKPAVTITNSFKERAQTSTHEKVKFPAHVVTVSQISMKPTAQSKPAASQKLSSSSSSSPSSKGPSPKPTQGRGWKGQPSKMKRSESRITSQSEGAPGIQPPLNAEYRADSVHHSYPDNGNAERDRSLRMAAVGPHIQRPASNPNNVHSNFPSVAPASVGYSNVPPSQMTRNEPVESYTPTNFNGDNVYHGHSTPVIPNEIPNEPGYPGLGGKVRRPADGNLKHGREEEYTNGRSSREESFGEVASKPAPKKLKIKGRGTPTSVKIENLEVETTEGDLREILAMYGITFASCRMIPIYEELEAKHTKAIIIFKNRDDALTCVKEFDGAIPDDSDTPMIAEIMDSGEHIMAPGYAAEFSKSRAFPSTNKTTLADLIQQ